jgi:hypothetical protein
VSTPDLAVRRVVRQAAIVTVPLVLVLALRSPWLGLALRLWLVALGAIGVAALASWALAGRAVGDGPDRRQGWGWWRRPRPERVRPLEELEHAVDFSLGTAFDVHYRLRPHLRRIAVHRLGTRGVSLDGQPPRARALLGAEAWELVRPDRPEPEDRNGRGLTLALLRRVVERLDAL